MRTTHPSAQIVIVNPSRTGQHLDHLDLLRHAAVNVQQGHSGAMRYERDRVSRNQATGLMTVELRSSRTTAIAALVARYALVIASPGSAP
jgi:hypothetical protein